MQSDSEDKNAKGVILPEDKGTYSVGSYIAIIHIRHSAANPASADNLLRPGLNPLQLSETDDPTKKRSSRSLSNYSILSIVRKPRKESIITKNVEGLSLIESFSTALKVISEMAVRRKFILKLAKALLTFGAPSHRIESQLLAAAKILDAPIGRSLL
jgi:hypothetical protein